MEDNLKEDLKSWVVSKEDKTCISLAFLTLSCERDFAS